jgi:VCBS repeat-containing protein
MTNPIVNNASAVVEAGSSYLVDPVTGLSSLGLAAVSAADGILSNAVDPNGNPLTVTAVSGANGSGAAGQTIAGTYGLLIVQPDGSYRYLLENASGPTGSPLQDVFTVAVSDGNGGTTTAQIDVTIDRPPVARDDIAVDHDTTHGSTIAQPLRRECSPTIPPPTETS